MMIVIGTLLLTALVGAPLFVIMGATTVALFFAFGDSSYEHVRAYQTLVVQMTDLTTKNVFLSIPFFVGSGAIMTEGGIAKRLVHLARTLVGWLPGGLAVASVVSCIVFAAISGSSPVTLIAVGSIMFPAMVKAGYRENFSLGLVTSAGSLGTLVPPAIPMIIYAIAVSGTAPVDIGDLFIAGLGGALFVSLLLTIYCVWEGVGMPQTRERFSWIELRKAFREGIWALALPFIILGGIYSGFFTPTEAAAVSVIYSIVATVFIYKELTLSRIPALLIESGILIGSLILIIVLSFGLNTFLIESDAAGWTLRQIQAWDLGPAGFFLVINILLIAIGALMDSISAILIFAPLLAPVALSLGIDPIHLGVVFIINMEIGYLMPPVATNLFVSSAVFKKPFIQVTKSVMPTLGIICLGLMIVTYVPTISNGLVNFFRGRPVYQAFPWDGAVEAIAQEPAEDAESAETAGAEAAPAEKKTMSLQEIMKAAKLKGETETPAAVSVPVESAPKRPLSLQEIMKKAKKDQEGQTP